MRGRREGRGAVTAGRCWAEMRAGMRGRREGRGTVTAGRCWGREASGEASGAPSYQCLKHGGADNEKYCVLREDRTGQRSIFRRNDFSVQVGAGALYYILKNE
ncbi:hypothetical protein XENTR_v10015559 [Xenopus tropicalis]|nr:hypothetical protein XENTR_v10015559 [Xenopus tropicalis]